LSTGLTGKVTLLLVLYKLNILIVDRTQDLEDQGVYSAR